MIHTFDTDVAELVGVNAAIIFQAISYWIKKNEANEEHYHDGSYWTYNSKSAWKLLFPYMGEKQFKSALQKLIDEGLIKTGCYNNKPFDRTLWYALTEKGESMIPKRTSPLVQNGTMEESKKDSPIPINIPISIPISNKGQDEDLNAKRFDSFWNAYPKHKRKAKQDAVKAWDKLKVDNELYTLIMKNLMKQTKSQDWLKENGKYVPHPATWLNGHRWEDEVEVIQQQVTPTERPKYEKLTLRR